MKTQFAEPAKVVEFVPHVLDLKKILVPVDFSDTSKKAFDCKRLTDHWTDRFDHIEKNDFAIELLGKYSVHSTLRIGHAPNEITKAAKDLDVDLIIMATHGYTSWRHLCIGSTTERVVRTAACPVLVVREKEHEFC
jgi:nucleotide-binding universal stress UspA family protein